MLINSHCPICTSYIAHGEIRCNRCGCVLENSLNFIENLELNEIFSKNYKLEGIIGASLLTVVFKAQQKRLGRLVAIKVVGTDVFHFVKTYNPFFKRALDCTTLNHFNVVKIYDVGSYSSGFYSVMEFIPGIELHRLITLNGKLLWKDVFEYGLQIAKGLDHIHGHNIVHGLINSRNVIITREGRAVIMDLSFSVEVTTSLLLSRGLKERYSFLSNYIWIDNLNKSESGLNPGSEIFNFGIILYECLTGKFPFEPGIPGKIYEQKNFKNVATVPPHVLVNEIPPWFSNIVMKCLEADKKKRFRSAGEIVEALMKYKV